MLFQILYFFLAAALMFQGLHLRSEVAKPLGTLPEEVGQTESFSLGWGTFLLTYGALNAAVGLLGYRWEAFLGAREILFGLDWLILAVFAAWLMFKGREVNYIGTPSADDHGHGHGHGHH